MIETMVFDFIGLGLIALCVAVVVTPGPRASGTRRFVNDDLTAAANANYSEITDRH